MFSQRWVMHVHADSLSSFTSLLFMWYIRNTDLLMRLQSQDHQELLLFSRQSVSSAIFLTQLTQNPREWSHSWDETLPTLELETDLLRMVWWYSAGQENLPLARYHQTHVHLRTFLSKYTGVVSTFTPAFLFLSADRPAKTFHPSSHYREKCPQAFNSKLDCQ